MRIFGRKKTKVEKMKEKIERKNKGHNGQGRRKENWCGSCVFHHTCHDKKNTGQDTHSNTQKNLKNLNKAV